MKITRLKKGYRINLSDSEYAALLDLVIRGEGELEGMGDYEWDELPSNIKRGLRTIRGRGTWALSDDRRKP
jgi:hypothetical protein